MIFNSTIIRPTFSTKSPKGISDLRWNDSESFDLVNARIQEKPHLSTSIRLMEAENILWIRFRCAATDIKATMTRYNDKVWMEGAVEIYLQPPNAPFLFEFQQSPIGTLRALVVRNPGLDEQEFDDRWSCEGLVAEATINRNAHGDVEGWDAIFGIPITSVQPLSGVHSVQEDQENQSDQGWRIGLYRLEYQPLEFSALATDPSLDLHNKHFLRPILFSMS